MSRVLVLGTGVSGLAAARLARDNQLAVSLYSEGQSVPALAEGFGVASGGWDPVLLNGVDLVVASPGFPERSLPIVEALEWGIPVWSEIEFAYRQIDVPVVAITGTNGKTTVAEATAAMLQASGLETSAVGNIGRPLSEFVGVEVDLLVVEVSSFQLRFCEVFHPNPAAITNFAPDHLDWHGSEAAYRDAKARIFANHTEDDLLVYDADDPGAVGLASLAPSRLYPVSATAMPPDGGGRVGNALEVEDVKVPLAELASSDPIHLANVAMAVAIARHAGGNAEAIAGVAREFEPGTHRRRVVGEKSGVTWVNDSKATNIHSALASIRSHESVVLLAGGLDKGQDVTVVAHEPNVRYLIGLGTSGPALVEAAGDRGYLAESMEAAVQFAAGVAGAGDTVLLAPACASFDQFESYEQRGDEFTRLALAEIGGPEE